MGVRSGNFTVSDRTGLLFCPNQSFLFLSNQQFGNFQICFPFSEASCWASVAIFSKLSFVEISLWIITEIWLLLVPLRAAFLTLLSARWFTLASRKSSFECPRILIIAKAAGKSIVCNNSWIQKCAAHPHDPVLDHPRISTIPQVLLSPFVINPHSCLQPYHPFHVHIVSSDLLSLPDICSPLFSAFCLISLARVFGLLIFLKNCFWFYRFSPIVFLCSVSLISVPIFIIFCLQLQFSRAVVSYSLWPHELHLTRPPCPSPTPGVYSNSCPSSRWCHPAISSSVVTFSYPQSLPESGSFPSLQLSLGLIWPSNNHSNGGWRWEKSVQRGERVGHRRK